MATKTSQTANIRYLKAWDLPTRLFHWINLLTIFILTILGLVMLYKSELGISGLAPKIGLKEIHSAVGYIFAINLTLRLIWSFVGSSSAKLTPLYSPLISVREISHYLKFKDSPPQYLGHNPLGKTMVAVLFILLIVMAGTGLFRAGTDIYYPPFGSAIQSYLAMPDTLPDQIEPYQDKGVNPEKQASLAPYKKWTGRIHLWGFWVLMLLMVLHIAGAIHTECRHQRGVISAMFSGYKPIEGKAVDEDR
ncbi:cytochrome b/b6 domain-containing protein [Shewanella submarina]|uniref:Cytochrome b/b6 domain-containing protein n=1 Tax=Shewanella submarina TaxID=2016376 RepID=A0ABV7GFK0_9GAMM|nr:cytochrome b/b6 domain-containing protein [Shewanella submarina]MCL1039700.1 cytochrome b/b6 domain-containing protein [Shewanella submarina]